MADRILKLIENKVTVAVAGGPLVAALAGQAAAAAAQPYVDDAEAAAASAQQNYEDALAIQALGDDAAAIAARVPKNTDGSDFANPLAVRGALSARPADGFVSVKDFYDDVAHAGDYGPALLAALAASPRVILPQSAGTYTFSSNVTATLTTDTIIDCNGQSITSDGGTVSFKGTVVASGRTLGANAPRYATSITLNDVTDIQAGDLVVITTTVAPSTDWTNDFKQDTVRVRSIAGSVLTLNEGLNFSYTTTDAGLDVTVYRPVSLTLIRPKVLLIADDADTTTHKAFYCEGIASVRVVEPEFVGQYPFTRATNISRNGIQFYYCHHVTVDSPRYEAMSYGAGAYGGCRYVSEFNVRARYCHHGHLDMGGWSSDYHLDGLQGADNYQVLNTHACFRAHAANVRAYNDTGLSNWRVCGGSLSNIWIESTVDDIESSQFQNNTAASGYEYINDDADFTAHNVTLVTPNRSSAAALWVKFGRNVYFEDVVAHSAVVGSVDLYVNGPGNRFGSNAISSPETIGATVTRYDGNAGRQIIIASAATITVPIGLRVCFISGTADISTITASAAYAGQVITLVFLDALTVTDGSNLALAGNFSATNGDSLTLACADGAAWYEVARSAN